MTAFTVARDIMTAAPMSVHPETNFNLVQVMSEWRSVRHIPVTDAQGKLVGMLSTRDMLEHLSQANASHFVPISKLMKSTVISAAPDTKVKELALLMIKNNIGCVPIVEGGKLVGVVSERDFLKIVSA